MRRRPTLYVAGGTDDVERVQTVQAALTELGFELTYDWTLLGDVRQDPSMARVVAGGAIDAASRAELIVVLADRAGRGAWVELGAALAGGAKALVVAPARGSVFTQHPSVEVVGSPEDAIDLVRSLAGTWLR